MIIDKEGEAMENYRVFISYPHEDTKLVEKIAKVLKENGLVPIRVKDRVSEASQLQLLLEPDVPKLVFPG